METKEYRIIKCYYATKVEKIINLPIDMDVIVDYGEIGDGLFIGAEHYCGVIYNDNKTDYEELFSDTLFGCVHFFKDIVFVELDNIIEVDKLPIISNEEFNSKYNIDSYYLTITDKPNIDVEKVFIKNDNLTVINEEYLKELSNVETKPHTYIKINNIRGAYSVDILKLIIEDDNNFVLSTLTCNLFSLLNDKYDMETKVLNGNEGKELFDNAIINKLSDYIKIDKIYC